ncbi:MAG: adenosylhomocysteinase [Zestosphaera tikiterensis]|uniref:Adenosylhomocysteinase n=1 Tax=Zestosphaera tikiterensis TaxID=1973259 RepID=A0A2R7Y4J9_9CREN|nr:MAG: adenosylhomocysteinase [Zestosphaera tikiterensis]
MSKIANPALWEEGLKRIDWAEKHMPVLTMLRRERSAEKPLEGVKVSAVLHVTKETAVLVLTLKAWGAAVWLAGSNPLSTQDDVAAALVHEGIEVCAWRGQTKEEYYQCIAEVASVRPNIVLDDGADLHAYLHSEGAIYANELWGGTEETTTGVIRLRALENEGRLAYPVIAVNDSLTKFMFDNRYGTGQSTIDGILRATNVLLAGKVFVVAGYGWVGKGIAMRARGMGARVIVTEVDPVKALEAVMDGYNVMPMSEASKVGDIFVTATGNINVIREEHILQMKDGAILANAGHFNVEINLEDLQRIAKHKRRLSNYVEEYTLINGRRVYVLAEGRLVNLVAAEGHPSEVMDMSFSNQALATLYIKERRNNLEKRVYTLPRQIDEMIAKLKLKSMGVEIDSLTEEQIKYLTSWSVGT